MDPIKGIAEQVKKIAETVAKASNPVRIGTVISKNSDGSYNVDPGDGGCVRVANLTNQPTQCGAQVVLGIEPGIGQTLTVCPVTVTIGSSTKPCPTDDRTDENEEEPEAPMLFTDDDGRIYDENGNPTGAMGDPAARDVSFDYEAYFWAGPSTNYLFLRIGNNAVGDTYGNQGIFQGGHTSGNTRLVQGVGASSGKLFGLELLNIEGSYENTWRLVIRNATTLAVIIQDTAPWLSIWFDSRPDSYPSFDDDYEYGNSLGVSADPVDGSFWMFAKAGVNGERAGLFKIDPTDATLIQTIDVDAVDGQFAKRMKRIS